MTIFVAIAAYRDADLALTMADCLAKARWPGDLRFGVCWQFAPGDVPPPDAGPAPIRRIDVPWQHSQGACWARDRALSLWDGETFLFQIDSHHRFVAGWDALLIDQIEASGTDRPLLTTYAQGFDPEAPPPAGGQPTAMMLHGFTDQGIAHFAQVARPQWVGGPPRRARFLSAHLIFTLGRFVGDVPYDPDLYFIGEEISLAIRAFTHGYDLLHPSAHVMWHEYSRRQRVMHWQDHQAAARDTASLDKVQQFLAGRITGRFGLGPARSLAEYETYAGVDFAARRATPAARRGDEPGPPPPPGRDVRAPRPWHVRIAVPRSAVPAAALDRAPFWYVGFHDVAGVEVARVDAEADEIRRLCGTGDAMIALERRFIAARPPVRWTIHPTDRRRHWLPPLGGAIEPENLITS
ncbi:GlcNAc-transferase family protein [Novosphingobium sp. FSW06-99]|uniref:GlcNAc-transferase family protein n=1 Tax=Novosphingobium sp. FSW06-99 TaxID=1739113 RepID=UPI00076C06E2|nr:GlcNAc-transferase family protein [Novosphingobium sp. FSW06-99]KUR72072.1 hypothetical protein AQZ49_20510 [Novosphingobium sp. FSW06-99]